MSYLIAGVDEAGISCLAGPVVAAAVILDPENRIYKLRDSKMLTSEMRDELYLKIKNKALAVSVGIATVEEIDSLNIFHANMLAMARAIQGLTITPSLILIDGRSGPKIDIPILTIVDGDKIVKSISAASIIAKVSRDKIMKDFHYRFPQYNFGKHKGYPTKEHQHALTEFGVCPIHRRSFAKVRNRLNILGSDPRKLKISC